MGACFCGLRNSASPNRPPNQDADKATCGGTESSTKLMNLRSLLAAMKTRKKQYSHRQENQEAQVCNKNMCKVLTLEDLIMASPGFNRGETLHVHRQSSKKIHPSFDGDCKQEFLPASFSVEMEAEEARNGQLENSSIFRSEKSQKLKKRVSFRSPEVADVFVMDSPVMYVGV